MEYMQAKLTLSLLNSLDVTGVTYEVHDTIVTGLFVRVTAAGHKAYVIRGARGKKKTLGRVGILTLDRARKEALNTSLKHMNMGSLWPFPKVRQTLQCPL